jgi:hypothetical protein
MGSVMGVISKQDKVHAHAMEYSQAPIQEISDGMTEEDTPPVDLKQEAVAVLAPSENFFEFPESDCMNAWLGVLCATSGHISE